MPPRPADVEAAAEPVEAPVEGAAVAAADAETPAEPAENPAYRGLAAASPQRAQPPSRRSQPRPEAPAQRRGKHRCGRARAKFLSRAKRLASASRAATASASAIARVRPATGRPPRGPRRDFAGRGEGGDDRRPRPDFKGGKGGGGGRRDERPRTMSSEPPRERGASARPQLALRQACRAEGSARGASSGIRLRSYPDALARRCAHRL